MKTTLPDLCCCFFCKLDRSPAVCSALATSAAYPFLRRDATEELDGSCWEGKHFKREKKHQSIPDVHFIWWTIFFENSVAFFACCTVYEKGCWRCVCCRQAIYIGFGKVAHWIHCGPGRWQCSFLTDLSSGPPVLSHRWYARLLPRDLVLLFWAVLDRCLCHKSHPEKQRKTSTYSTSFPAPLKVTRDSDSWCATQSSDWQQCNLWKWGYIFWLDLCGLFLWFVFFFGNWYACKCKLPKLQCSFWGRHTEMMYWFISWQDLSDLLALFAVCREKQSSMVFNEKQNKATLQARATFWLSCLYPLVGFWISVIMRSSFYAANEKQDAFAHVFYMPAFEVVMLYHIHSQWTGMDATRQGFLWPFKSLKKMRWVMP